MLLYLHGFASGPSSTKAQAFKARWPELVIPDLNEGEGGFERLTLGRILGQIDALAAGRPRGEPLVLFGSSLGGYSAALWQARHRGAVGLVLLAPAFDLAARWRAEPKLERGPDGRARAFHYARKVEVPFDEDGFLADAERYEPFPDVGVPTLILHGRDDGVVPVELARRFCDRQPEARLVVFDDGHELGRSIPSLIDEAALFVAGLLS